MATLEERLRAFCDAWVLPQPCTYDAMLECFRQAANLGDSEGYARGRAEALEEAARVAEGNFYFTSMTTAEAIRALAQRTQEKKP